MVHPSNELSGTVLGPSVQAGTVHGDVHIHEVADGRVPVPRQLLAAPPRLVGRRVELARLDGLLDPDGARIGVLTGPGGVGKTALAMRWAHGVRAHFPDGELYADLCGWTGEEPLDPGQALGAFLRALGVPPRRVPLAMTEQAALFRSLTAGRCMLVVLDSVYSAAQARPLLAISGA